MSYLNFMAALGLMEDGKRPLYSLDIALFIGVDAALFISAAIDFHSQPSRMSCSAAKLLILKSLTSTF
jgi:hypothetical protein